MTTPAPKRGLVSDAPTGRLNFSRVGPSDGLRDGSGSVRTSFSVPTALRFSPPSRGSRSGRSPSCLSTEIASTSWSSSWPSTVIGSRGGAVAVAEATAGANRGRNHGRKQAPSHGGLTRPAKPHPEGTPTSSCGGGCGGRLRYRTLHYANARVRTPTDHGLSVSIPISGVSA